MSAWAQVGSDILGPASGDIAGFSVDVSLDGSIIAFGAPGVANGAIREFEWVPPSISAPNSNVISYVPSQTERADQLHQLQCPCSGTLPPGPTDYATRNRRIRSLATGCCATYGIVSITVTGSSGFAEDDFLQLVGGVPVAKPLLVKVTGVDGSGGITGVAVVYAGQYYQKPAEPYTMTVLSGSSVGDLTVNILWAEVCPCPWTYKKAGSSGLDQDCCRS